MKNLYLLIFLLVLNSGVSAQWITSITINPPQPTTADTINIIIENMFPSGGCDGTSTLTGISGSIITAQGMHCIGMLTVICTDFDTIIIPPQTLPIGTYNFVYSLETGTGFPCAFGSIPPVGDTVFFNVDPVTAVNEMPGQTTFRVFPNPSTGKFTLLQSEGKSIVRVYTTDGRLLNSYPIHLNETEIICNLNPGVYFIAYERNGIVEYSKMIIE